MNTVTLTVFRDLTGAHADEHVTTLDGLADWLRSLPPAAGKAQRPLISLARYSGNRCDASIIEHHGAVIDHDAGRLAPEHAAETLRAFGIAAVVQTSASHTADRPAFHVLLPFAAPCDAVRRNDLLAVADALLGGDAASESYTGSQSYFVGAVAGAPYHVWHVDGMCIDQLPGVDQLPRRERPAPTASAPADWTTAPIVTPACDGDDEAVVAALLACSGHIAGRAFGNQCSAADLWHGNAEALARAFPPQGPRDDGLPYDASSADAALLCRLARLVGGDCDRVLRIAQRSALARPKWSQRGGDYLRRTITRAVAHVCEPEPDTALALTPPPDGKRNTLLEAAAMTQAHVALAHDEFADRVVVVEPPPWNRDDGTTPRAWTEADTVECQAWLQSQLYRPSKDAVYDAVRLVAHRNPNHPVRNYLDGLQWDGEARLNGWLSRYLGAEDTPWTRTVGPKFCIAAVARIFQPGCKVDTVLIMEGLQGIRKSTAVATLASADWFTDELPDVTHKDAAMQLRGVWIVEVAELDAMNRSETSAVKKFMSRSVDRYRPPFGRIVVDVPRQCVFIGTTNDESYLKDQTGNRRYWPVACGAGDMDALARDRDQLWAEAVTRYRAGEPWWLSADQETTLAQPEQDARREPHAWEEPIAAWLATHQPPEVTTGFIATFVLGIPKDRQTSGTTRDIAACLRTLGWKLCKTKKRALGADHPVRVFVKQR